MAEEHQQKDDRQDYRHDPLGWRRQREHPEHQENDIDDQRQHEQPDEERDEPAAGESEGGGKNEGSW